MQLNKEHGPWDFRARISLSQGVLVTPISAEKGDVAMSIVKRSPSRGELFPRVLLASALAVVLFMPTPAPGQFSRLRRFVDQFLPTPNPTEPTPNPAGVAASTAEPPLLADEAPAWTGQRILTTSAGVRIGHTDQFGRPVYLAELTDVVYRVQQEQNGWLLVRHRGTPGWLAKRQAVRLEDAVRYFTDRIQAGGRDALAFAHRGRAMQETGQLERALDDFDEAIHSDPQHAAWYCGRALVYAELRDFDRAIRDYDRAIRLDPKDALAYNGRGKAWKAQSQYKEAIADLSEAIRLAPAWSEPYFNRGNASKGARDYAAAIRDYSEAIRLEPDWPDAYFNRANTHYVRKEYAEAVQDYRTVIRLEAQDADAYGNLAWILATCPDARVRDGKSAVDCAAKACELTSWKAPYFLTVFSAACAENGAFDEAVKWQELALESPDFARNEGESARRRLALFKNHQTYRED